MYILFKFGSHSPYLLKVDVFINTYAHVLDLSLCGSYCSSRGHYPIQFFPPFSTNGLNERASPTVTL